MTKQEERQKKLSEKIFKNWSKYDLMEKLWAVFVFMFTITCVFLMVTVIVLAITGKLFSVI